MRSGGSLSWLRADYASEVPTKLAVCRTGGDAPGCWTGRRMRRPYRRCHVPGRRGDACVALLRAAPPQALFFTPAKRPYGALGKAGCLPSEGSSGWWWCVLAGASAVRCANCWSYPRVGRLRGPRCVRYGGPASGSGARPSSRVGGHDRWCVGGRPLCVGDRREPANPSRCSESQLWRLLWLARLVKHRAFPVRHGISGAPMRDPILSPRGPDMRSPPPRVSAQGCNAFPGQISPRTRAGRQLVSSGVY